MCKKKKVILRRILGILGRFPDKILGILCKTIPVKAPEGTLGIILLINHKKIYGILGEILVAIFVGIRVQN